MRTVALLFVLTMTMAAQTMQENKPAETESAKTTTDEAVEQAKELIGRATFLRCLCADEKQSYDESGKLVGAVKKPMDWTLAAIDVEKAARKDATHIELTGTRVGIRYNENAKIFERKPLKLDTIHIEMIANNAAQVKKALDNIFAIGIDYRLQQATTPVWKRYFNPQMPWGDDWLKGKAIYIPTAKDTNFVAAKPTKKVDIPMTAEARQNKINGTIQMRAVIDTDGTPHRVALKQPLGFGLDENAVDAVSKWHFAPATKDGKPVITEMTIEEHIVVRQNQAAFQ